jgi:hypothetical protein
MRRVQIRPDPNALTPHHPGRSCPHPREPGGKGDRDPLTCCDTGCLTRCHLASVSKFVSFFDVGRRTRSAECSATTAPHGPAIAVTRQHERRQRYRPTRISKPAVCHRLAFSCCTPALENTDRTASSKSFSRTNSAATGRSATITGLAPLSSKRPYAGELLTSGPPRSKVAGATPSPHQWDDKVYAGSAAALLKVGDKQRN